MSMVRSVSMSPSGNRTPETIPSAPRSLLRRMSSKRVWNSTFEYKKSPFRGRMSTNTGISNNCLQSLILPAPGVTPPWWRFSHSSMRSAPPSCALIAGFGHFLHPLLLHLVKKLQVFSSPDFVKRTYQGLTFLKEHVSRRELDVAIPEFHFKERIAIYIGKLVSSRRSDT